MISIMGNCIYGLIKWLFKPKSSVYIKPIDDISKNNDFECFKNNDKLVNKVVFCMNNIPDKVFKLIFCEFDTVNTEFNEINMEKKSGKYVVKNVYGPKSSTNTYRYIYYRINLINYKGIGHVNCLIIDNTKKYGLFFDSQVDLKYSPKELVKYIDIPDDYQIVEPRDLGMNFWKKIQRFDCFCQTYILLVFLAIIKNDNLQFPEIGNMLVETINDKTVGHFLFYLYSKLKQEGFRIGNVNGNFSYPKNRIRKITNSLNILCCTRKKPKYENQRLLIKEEDDCVIVNL